MDENKTWTEERKIVMKMKSTLMIKLFFRVLCSTKGCHNIEKFQNNNFALLPSTLNALLILPLVDLIVSMFGNFFYSDDEKYEKFVCT